MKVLSWAAAAMLCGCASQVTDVKGGAITAPAIATPAPQPSPSPPLDNATSVPANAVIRDTRALQRQATTYVVRKDSKPEVIDTLSTLTLQTRQAVGRMQAHRAGHVYRPADVTAARVAADLLAAFLQTQAKPDPEP